MNDEQKRLIAQVQHGIAQEVRDTIITFRRYGIPYTTETIGIFFGRMEKAIDQWIEIEKTEYGRESTPPDQGLRGSDTARD